MTREMGWMGRIQTGEGVVAYVQKPTRTADVVATAGPTGRESSGDWQSVP